MSTRVLSVQFVRYALVGASNTAITLAVYSLLLSAGRHYLEAFAPAFAAGAINGYTLNRIWTFDAARYRGRGLARYVVVQVAGLGLNGVLLVTLVEGLGIAWLPAQVISIGVVSLLSFAAARTWVFRDG